MQNELYTLTVIYKTPNSPDEFKKHYLEKHIPLALQLPGLINSKYSFNITEITDNLSPFCIWQGNFDSPESIANAMESDIGKKVQTDAGNIATGGISIFFYKQINN